VEIHGEAQRLRAWARESRELSEKTLQAVATWTRPATKELFTNLLKTIRNEKE
jgi:hypothetical protein